MPAGSADPADRADRGAGGVLVLAVVALVLTGAAALAAASSALGVHARTQTAADLAALAAADAVAVPAGVRLAAGLVVDPAVACDRADQVAARHRTRLAACVVDGEVVTVTVEGASVLGAVSARARAGPRE